ncbi:lytic transglycosylase domain-containing protein [Erythrobacter insulae]|uniref:Lytic transglycosylase domain-containing protein n=1 Tax=Erythrobacter insulae TaxID=2584124 RepID=A0A547PEX3_9SPHN|nr:lytic transglycosylase domain-containing protein [Erythrobacter insulae]
MEQAIANAARQTDVDFGYLVAQAQVESAMDPAAKASTSSATGLYQFIESTWLGTVKRHGTRFGLGDIASRITATSSGAAYVSDPADRSAILALRNDPQIASFMAAGLAEDNRAHLKPVLGREPDSSELYLAHFMGAGGASKFLSAMAQNPDQKAANLFPRPAAANRPIFFERSGSPRSLQSVMNVLSGKLERAMKQANLSEATVAGPAAARPPYIIADETVFGPADPPAISGRNRARFSMGQAPNLRSDDLRAQARTSRPSMSAILNASFASGTGMTSPEASQRIQRAYTQLKAFGL